MDDHVRSFLDDILAHPHDDAPRLIFADWIDDHADALPAEVRDRGQLIRVQYALEGLDDDDPRRPMLQTRAAALIQAHPEWTEGFQRDWHRPTFRRGFVEGIELNLAMELPAVLQDHPIRRLRISYYHSSYPHWASAAEGFGLPGHLAEACSTPVLSQVNELDVTGFRLTEGDEESWLAAARLDRLASLTAHGEQFLAAVQSSRLDRLKSLTVLGDVPARVRFDVLAPVEQLTLYPSASASPWLRRLGRSLRRLTVTGRDWGRVRSPLLPPEVAARLEAVDLSGGWIDLRKLAKAGPFPRLGRLTLKAGQHHERSWAGLTADAFPALRSLNLRNVRLRHAEIEQLVTREAFGALEALYPGYNRIGPDTAAVLAARLPNGLRTLDLCWNSIGDRAVGAIIASHAASTLRFLDLSYCSLGPESARCLAALPANLPLIALNLGTNLIRPAGLRQLLDSPALGRLEALDVSNNHLNDDAADALLAWPRLRDVSLLAVHGNDLSAAALDRLRAGFRGLLL